MATPFRRIRSGKRGFYYARVLVPADLRTILSPRRELFKSLDTASYRAAKERATRWECGVLSLFSHIRQCRSRMTPKEIKAIVQRYVDATLEDCEEARAAHPESEEQREGYDLALSDFLEGAVSDLLKGDFTRVQQTADELLHANKIKLTADSPAYRRLCVELLKGQQSIFKTEMARLNGDYFAPEGAAYRPSLGAAASNEAEPPLKSLLFSEAVPLYFKNFKRTANTETRIQYELSRFIEILGGDRPIQSIRKADCRNYRDTLRQLPANMAKRYPGDAVADVLKRSNADARYERLTDRTVNQALQHVGHFFTWATNEGYYRGENPIKGLALSGAEEGTYEPFTDEDLKRIFSAPGFIKQLARRPDRYFILLALLLTGARREEVCQLGIADVKLEKGVWFFDIAPDVEQGKRVKTKASRRRVPLHPLLIRLGFMRYASMIRAAGHARLFPMLKRGKGGKYGDAVGKWFARLLRSVGIKSEKKVVHSFRHTVNTQLYSRDVPAVYVRMLLGHEGETVNEAVYLHRAAVPLSALNKYLSRLDFSKALEGLPRPRSGKPATTAHSA